jgi:glycosyltransferase involved in cell wall biosynthesis
VRRPFGGFGVKGRRVTLILDVLIPHYCNPDGLRNSLDSIAGQTWRGRLRAVVVDDGSPADQFARVEAICAAFRESSGFDCLLLRNPSNLGRPRTRNVLLDAVEARYVAWLDAEDIWYPDKLRLQFEHLMRLDLQGRDIDAVWVTCTYDWAEAGKRMRAVQQRVSEDQLRDLLIGSKLRSYLWTLLGTAESFRMAGRFDERLPRLQDTDYFVNFVRAGGVLDVPPTSEPLCRYYKSDVGRSASDVRDAFRLILAKNAPALRRYPASFSSELHYKANMLGRRFALSNGRYDLGALYLAQAMLLNPRHSLRVLAGLLVRRLRSAGSA